jgi:hypothetical protein
MINRFIELIENLDLAHLELMMELYHPSSVFRHPLNSVKGPTAIKRQWKLTLKYCPNTKITILENLKIDSTTYFLKWLHEFDYKDNRKTYEGTSLITVDENLLIVEQTDKFKIEELMEKNND